MCASSSKAEVPDFVPSNTAGLRVQVARQLEGI